MYKSMHARSSFSWLPFLERFVDNMNSTRNRSTGFSPKQAQHNVDLVAARRLASYGRKYKDANKMFEIGDRVRRRLHRPKYSKAHVPYWSKATYRIVAKNVPKNHQVALTSYKIALWSDATKIRRGVYNVSSLQGPILDVQYGPDHAGGSDDEDDADSSGDDAIIPNPGVEEESDDEPLLDPRIHRRRTAKEQRELEDLRRTAPRPTNATRRPIN